MKLKLSVLSIALFGLYGCGGSDSNSSATDSATPPTQTYSSLVKATPVPTNDSICTSGGIKIDLGLDKDDSKILENGEVLQSHTYCNSGVKVIDGDLVVNNDALVSVLSIAKNDVRCNLGGQLVIAGIDADNNNKLSEQEISEEHILCSDGEYIAPDILINAIVASPAVILPSETTTITATISNLSDNDTLTWYDSGDNIISPVSVNQPQVIALTAGNTSGVMSAKLEVKRVHQDGSITLHAQKINVTIAEAPSKTQSVVMDNTQVLLPEGYSTQNITGDFKGVVMYGEVPQQIQKSGIPTPVGTELIGFTSERPSLSQGSTTVDILNTLMRSLNSTLGYRNDVTEISKKTLVNGDISARYNISLSETRQTTALLQLILQTIGTNKVGGVVDQLVADNNEKNTNAFQFDIVLSFDEQKDNVVMTSTLIAKELFSKYETLIDTTTSESVRAPVNATIKVQNDTITAIEQTVSKADFLFVIDNSGSMGDEQDEISTLTQTFLDEISASGLDYKVGTITTDNDSLRGNGFTHEPEQIALDFKPGTNGSGYERGIYFAEMALAPTTGTVAVAGYPRAGASLSVIIMSDEESQYPTRDFDVNNNLFVDNGYRVYSIVDPSDARVSQYDDLSQTSLGLVLNINEKTEYKQFMTDIANNAGASTVGYKLGINDASKVISTSLSVKVDGVEVTRDKVNGWTYYPQTNSISFRGTAIPAAGAEIVIAYNYIQL